MSKRAIVLAGGGSRGAYQLGAWRAFRELGLDYQIVTGTSVGALNGAMMVQGDYEQASALWENLVTTDVVRADIPTDAPDYSDPRWESEVWAVFIKKAVQDGGLDFSPLEGIMARYTSEERLRASDVDFGVVTVEYPTLKPLELSRDQIPQGKLIDYVVASAACFPAFRVKEIDQAKYIDGGYQDNMPVNLALRMGAEEVVAIDLKSAGIRRVPKNCPVPIRVIRSRWSLGPFLWFEPALSARNIALGYLDTLRAFGKMEGDWYAFESGNWEKHTALLAGRLGLLTQKVDADGKDPLVRMGKLRLLHTLGLGSSGSGNVEALVMPAAETAGRLLKLSPTRCYRCGEFDQGLLDAFSEARAQAAEQLSRFTVNDGSFSELTGALRREGKQYLLSLVHALLCRALEGERPAADFWRLALAAPSETAAASYLWLLEQEAETAGKEVFNVGGH